MTVQSPCQRTAPFLHRTWIKGVKALQDSADMGSIMSSPVHRSSHPANGLGDGPRPAKARRLLSPDSLDMAAPRISDSVSTLRIEVLKILHKDSKKVKSYQSSTAPRDLLTTKARCRITISDMSSASPQVLHCQSQLCDLITFKNPVGPHRVARVDLPRPFYVPHESILINRYDDGRFDLSDSYQLLVEFEAANGLRWPPLDSHDFGLHMPSPCPPWVSAQHCILSTRFDTVVGRLKQPLTLTAKHSPNLMARHPSGQTSYQTDYVMDVDLRWAAGFKALGRLDHESKSCITAIDPDVDGYAAVDLENSLDDGLDTVNGRVNGDATHDAEGEFAGDHTPSRSLRTREKSRVYNLKVLSDQAQGREKKKRGRSTSVAASEGRVQYLLPSDQPVCLDFNRCVSCGAYHESMPQLQLHLRTAHPAYDYLLETTSQGPQFRVSALRESFPSPKRAYHLGHPALPFNLHTVTTSDQSWLTSRLGPESDELFNSPSARPHVDRLRSPSPAAKGPRVAPRRTPKPKPPNKILVPALTQPLYHPISKARLKPGQEVPETPPDDTWLIQKHRESIGDFSDVTAAEKEYIWEWDGYILGKNLTSTAYFPSAWLGFVKEKAAWLVAEKHRMLEFGKHSSVLLVRDVLDDKIMNDAFVFIKEARSRSRRVFESPSDEPSSSVAAAQLSPRSAQIRKSAKGCAVCQLPVLGPTLLVCSNTSCSRRLYHSTCIEEKATVPVTRSKWLCNACSVTEMPG